MKYASIACVISKSLITPSFIGRIAVIVPALALAGFLSERKVVAESVGTFPVATPLFVGLLISVILIVGALTFFPALLLGPIVQSLSTRVF